MTDMARLRAGRVGGQFWSVYIDGTITGDAAIRETIEQIDIVKRMIEPIRNDLELALHRRRRRPHPQERARSPR